MDADKTLGFKSAVAFRDPDGAVRSAQPGFTIIPVIYELLTIQYHGVTIAAIST